MKKIAIFLVFFAGGLCAVFGLLYKIDIARMANNEDVIFSNWGMDYNKDSENTHTSDNVNDPLYMQAELDTLTTRGMNVTIVNNTNNDAAFGDYYAIEKYTGGQWKKLAYVTGTEPGWNDMTYIIEKGASAELNFYWADMYGELEKGEYRLEKLYIESLNSDQINYLYCYFQI